MARKQANKAPTSKVNSNINGTSEKTAIAKHNGEYGDEKTDYSRWRLKAEQGRHTWHYIDEEECKEWKQSVADKYHLGIPTDLPDLPLVKTPLDSARNGLSFFSHLQLPPGHWGCEYGGPMFLLPGIVITWYITNTTIPESRRIEIRNYLFARQHPDDGGWGLHIEGHSSVFGTTMNYTVLRIVGAEADDPRMVKARGLLHSMGGALYGPHWAKWWLSVLGVSKWDLVNPVPPELWLLPDWVPIAPWRWWIHIRQVFLPMSFVYSRRWTCPETELVRELRQELFVQPYETINFFAHRNSISAADNYHPKSWLLNTINWALANVWNPYLRTQAIADRAEAWTWSLIQMEDEHSDFADLAPVNAAMNMVACYIQDGPDAHSVGRHRERLDEFLWVKSEGMLANGTNGVQTWDTAFAIDAAHACGFANDPRFKPAMVRALEFLDNQQIREDCQYQDAGYRHRRKGAWAFSTREQGYTVSDCTSVGGKAVMLLQGLPGFPQLVSEERLRDAADLILTMQNPSGGCSSYELQRGSEHLEMLNAAEVFGRIMVEYDYPECTTACVSFLSAFSRQQPDYRAADIAQFVERAVAYIRRAQRADGSWYGAWGICFSYAGMFALEALASVGETYGNSERVRQACQFFVDRQRADGGWGESYKSCETGVWTEHKDSQVVQTAWVCIALMKADYPERAPLERALRLIMGRQMRNGEWLQEAIEGVFNKSCMISYPNYKFIFPMKALGMFAKRYGDIAI